MGAAATIGGHSVPETSSQHPEEMPPIAPRLLTDLLDHAVEAHGAWPAIDFMGRKWTYREIGDLSRRAARGFQDLGVKRGTRVGLCLPNTPYYVICYFAILRIGGIVVNFNPLYTEREMAHLVDDSGAEFIVASDLALSLPKIEPLVGKGALRRVVVCPIADALPRLKGRAYRLLKRKDIAHEPHDLRFLRFADLIARDADPDPVERSPSDLAVLQYTGGTTGVPKGAMLSHANLAANSAQMIAHVGHMPEQQERTLGVLPLFHVFALTTVLNYSVDTAAEMILLPRFEMKSFLATAKRTKPTQFFGVPTLYTALNNQQLHGEFDQVRVCISGGAPLPLEVRQKFEQRTGVRVVEGYGLSEASPIIACNPLEGDVKDNSCGPAFPGTALEIRDPDNPHRIMPQGERGEVCARGPQVMSGYWNRPEESEKTFIFGALRTGDVGYLDEDGYLFLVDRIKDMILCGGYNVYPRTIEDALYEHPMVHEAIVIGVPDAYRGQAPKAFVALHPGDVLDQDTLMAFLKERLNKIEMPSSIEFRDSLPKTLVGKLSKKELVEEEAARRAAGSAQGSAA
ncbi:long-chain-fatty-acid--CoA ligase [Novosphingobium aerophilum]|uniref:long-chain-fatty-acid--CoA ligase n=1 Tax=Novosphingobium TaxID=165696 RepID=UPI0006C89A0D|nr:MULTISPECIES: long-chain fatty acid--CoA ligase [unclassified Novosphingobium]MPS68579.1 long-chain fatty acid--CoA ligase [Novosphingobium sp.]TCM36827.1 long-chain acyl-CoA synthetase [Novosphingobium sp. ST904]WRT93911.1 long-chain fatty acid--CoA ligase [Novosphingobium sp. RL4]